MSGNTIGKWALSSDECHEMNMLYGDGMWTLTSTQSGALDFNVYVFTCSGRFVSIANKDDLVTIYYNVDDVYKNNDVEFTENELSELSSRLVDFQIDLNRKFQYHSEITLDSGLVIWYIVEDVIVTIVNAVKDCNSNGSLSSADERGVYNSIGKYVINYDKFQLTDDTLTIGNKVLRVSKWKLNNMFSIITYIGNLELIKVPSEIDGLTETDKSESIGMKFDDDKLLCMAFPAMEYKQIIDVLTKGANKYKIDNWKHVENGRNRYMNGLERHFLDYKEAIQTGNNELKFDNGEGGMGTNHLANLICNAIFLLYFDNNNID